jgi:hypothetical protein
METSLKCWIYKCPKSKCGLVAVVNQIVLEHRYANGVIPCPRCGQRMKRNREAQPGEFDREKQEALAAWASQICEFRVIPPWETFGNATPRMGGVKVTRTVNEAEARINDDYKIPSAEMKVEAPKFLTETDVAGILGISVRAVRRLVKDKKLRPIRLTKRKKLFTQAVVDDFIQRETGLVTSTSGGNDLTRSRYCPKNTPISLEESRSLLKGLRKSSLDEPHNSTSVSSRR